MREICTRALKIYWHLLKARRVQMYFILSYNKCMSKTKTKKKTECVSLYSYVACYSLCKSARKQDMSYLITCFYSLLFIVIRFDVDNVSMKRYYAIWFFFLFHLLWMIGVCMTRFEGGNYDLNINIQFDIIFGKNIQFVWMSVHFANRTLVKKKCLSQQLLFAKQ